MARRVLVTAGAAGIGAAIVRAFLADGARVFTCDVADGALDALRAAHPALGAARCDVGDHAAVRAMVSDAAAFLGGLDVLVNNAGIGGPTMPVQDLPPAEWEAVLRVNLTGAFNVAQAAIPHLIAAGGGAIVNMSSAAGRFGYPNRSPYAASKWGLIGLTRTLSMELGGHGIRVNALAPGAVSGERMERVLQGRATAAGLTVEEVTCQAMANQSIKRMVDPEEIAALVLFLASDTARSISGQVIPIDNDYQRN